MIDVVPERQVAIADHGHSVEPRQPGVSLGRLQRGCCRPKERAKLGKLSGRHVALSLPDLPVKPLLPGHSRNAGQALDGRLAALPPDSRLPGSEPDTVHSVLLAGPDTQARPVA